MNVDDFRRQPLVEFLVEHLEPHCFEKRLICLEVILCLHVILGIDIFFHGLLLGKVFLLLNLCKPAFRHFELTLKTRAEVHHTFIEILSHSLNDTVLGEDRRVAFT